MPELNGSRSKVNRSALRTLDILEAVAASGRSCSIAEVSEQTCIPSPTVFRLLDTLSSRGYVVKNNKREYSIGAAFFNLASSAGESMGSSMDGTLIALVDKTGESASAAMLDGTTALYIAHRSSNQSIRAYTRVGQRVPVNATAVGKVLLAALPDEQIEGYLNAASLPQVTERTIVTAKGLWKEIAAIRKQGYALDNEEQEIGVRCMAMCVPDMGRFAISISGPLSRMTDKYLKKTAQPELKEAIDELGRDLQGHTSHDRPVKLPKVEPVYMGLGI